MEDILYKVMISQPMNGRSEKEIKEERQNIIEKFNKMHIEVINTLFTEEVPDNCNVTVYYLGKSISAMKDIDALYMCDNWFNARRCKIENQVAREYGIKILDKEFFVNKPIMATRDLERSKEDIKTSDEMLEELGYKILFKDKDIIQYEYEGVYMDNEIKFDLKGKTILKEYSTGESQEITIQELQAIYKKCKELGLIE